MKTTNGGRLKTPQANSGEWKVTNWLSPLIFLHYLSNFADINNHRSTGLEIPYM